MKIAIVSGANGYLGQALIKNLLEHNIKVFAIARTGLLNLIDPNLVSIKSDLNDIESVLNKFEGLINSSGAVFYHAAWRGDNRLMDGELGEQLTNTVNSVNALKIANHLKCSKFINIGSQEERLFDRQLANQNKECASLNVSNLNYVTAKLASRDMCRLVAYMDKIDYIHTRLSVITDPNSDKGYINSTLNKIKTGKPYEKPQNSQLYDFTHIADVTNAYVELGKYGKNNSDYYIGSGNPRALDEYFNIYSDYIKNGKRLSFCSNHSGNPIFKEFNNQLVLQDTGVQFNDFQDYIIKDKEL
jgi:nucleoside-diphosphate-sugar epimerase